MGLDHLEQDRRKSLEILLADDNFTVQPGFEITLHLEIRNHGELDDRVSPRIEGIPPSWMTAAGSYVKVVAGETIIVPLRVYPPRSAETIPGRYDFHITVVSQQYSDVEAEASASLTVGSYSSFDMMMEPLSFKLPGTVRVIVKNTGNSQTAIRVSGQNPDNEIMIQGERTNIVLAPKQIETIDLQLSQRRRFFIGSKRESSFIIETSIDGGASKSMNGKAIIGSVVPPGLVYLLLFLFSFTTVFTGLLLLLPGSGIEALFRSDETVQESAVPTTSSSVIFDASTGISAARETVQAASGLSVIDSDGDGLTDVQEELIGTDADDPDSDQDRIDDGEELLSWGTNPSRYDTDGDQLSDGVEIITYKTDPLSPDSDHDGLLDGVEVTTGSDPLKADESLAAAGQGPAGSDTSPSGALASSRTVTSVPTTLPETQAETDSLTPIPPARTATPTPEPSPTAADTPIPPVQITCSVDVPFIDGVLNDDAWGEQPAVDFIIGAGDERRISIFSLHTAEHLYMAASVDDPIWNPAEDAITIYIDANNNSGDPDVEDRIFQLDRNGILTQWTGIGHNADGRTWEPGNLTGSWYGVVAGTGQIAWIAEFIINATIELPGLQSGSSFRIMIRAQLADGEGIWPEGALDSDSGTWRPVSLGQC